jgi:hypothetical protein
MLQNLVSDLRSHKVWRESARSKMALEMLTASTRFGPKTPEILGF